MNPSIIRIRSGGQSGVDRAALDFARKHNIEICGWCPKGGPVVAPLRCEPKGDPVITMFLMEGGIETCRES